METYVLWLEGEPVRKSADFEEIQKLRWYYQAEGFRVIIEIENYEGA